VTHLLPLLFYIGAFIVWVRCLFARTQGRSVLVASVLTGAGVLAHALALVEFWLRYDQLPLVGPGAALSSLAFVGGLALVAVLPLREVARVAIALLPFIIVVQGVAIFLGIQPTEVALDFSGAGFVLHVALAFLGYQGLAIAFAAGVLYLIQHNELKEKRLGRFFHFIPPLATLDRLARVGLWGGFACLTLSLAFGWAWTVQYRGSLELSDPKVIWAVLSWIVFAAVLTTRVGGWRNDHRGALAAVIGFAVVICSYLILRLTVGGTGFFL
jgi:ABC-type uncharacterized transport system permease subunit